MDTFVEMYQTLRDMRKRQLAHQVLNLAMIVCSALMIWKSLMVITESESPVVVVLSGSMEPAFHRGDILFLHMGFTPFRSGDIVVFKVADREIPIVHRIIKVHEKEDGTVDLLTKGDNNAVDDRGLYAASQSWIHREHVIGRAKGCASERGAKARGATRRDARAHGSHDLRPRPQVSTVHRDGDDHHERLPDRQVHPRRADGPVRTDDKRISKNHAIIAGTRARGRGARATFEHSHLTVPTRSAWPRGARATFAFTALHSHLTVPEFRAPTNI